ncbi:hypothetical protein PIB30_018605 [Stylosanthes scabra]|uniref:Bowman-Birk serine protease inhibitors family domain-containing protein n=1 Tax=Stylosanthes scabra TaxID=79078 RepID=A0ABU6S852_9FABA|nr:hypothetical protein [Stylosanthes scabra]
MMILVRVVLVVFLFINSFSTTIEAAGRGQLELNYIITTKNIFNIDNDDNDVMSFNFLKPSSLSDENCCKACYHHEGLLFNYYLCQDIGKSCHESCKNCICGGYFSSQGCHCIDTDTTKCPIPECK